MQLEIIGFESLLAFFSISEMSFLSLFLRLLLLILLYKFIIQPLIIASYYKLKYGSKIAIYYFPVLGTVKEMNDGTRKYNDAFGWFKNKVE